MVENVYLLPSPRAGGRAGGRAAVAVARAPQKHDGHHHRFIQVAYIDAGTSPTARHAPNMRWTRLCPGTKPGFLGPIGRISGAMCRQIRAFSRANGQFGRKIRRVGVRTGTRCRAPVHGPFGPAGAATIRALPPKSTVISIYTNRRATPC